VAGDKPSSPDSVHRPSFRFGKLRTNGRSSGTNLSSSESCNTSGESVLTYCSRQPFAASSLDGRLAVRLQARQSGECRLCTFQIATSWW
jgi:hypothetical protein